MHCTLFHFSTDKNIIPIIPGKKNNTSYTLSLHTPINERESLRSACIWSVISFNTSSFKHKNERILRTV